MSSGEERNRGNDGKGGGIAEMEEGSRHERNCLCIGRLRPPHGSVVSCCEARSDEGVHMYCKNV